MEKKPIKGRGTQAVRPIPKGYHTVTPWIIARGAAELIEYLKAAFGAVELGRVNNPDGKIGHAEVRMGDSVVMLFDAGDDWPDTPSFNRLYVEDAEVVFEQALKAGGTAVTGVTSLGFGDVVGRVRDPKGNLWWIQQHIEDLTPEEMGQRATDPTYAQAMEQVEESLRQEMRGRKGK